MFGITDIPKQHRLIAQQAVLTFVLHIPIVSCMSWTGSSQSVPAGMSQRSIRLSCDRHLLAAAHTAITLSPLLAVLKVRQPLSSFKTFAKYVVSSSLFLACLSLCGFIAGHVDCQRCFEWAEQKSSLHIGHPRNI